MRLLRQIRVVVTTGLVLVFTATALAQGTQAPAKPFEPQVGQAGKDVVWVPTPQALVDKMLDMAKVTPKDFLMDLGSGDGRTVITAAKRGAARPGHRVQPGHGRARRSATPPPRASPTRATFIKADLFETDFSKAQVITMFLLPTINMKLRPTILEHAPGHAHRVELVHDGGLAARPERDDRPSAPAGARRTSGSCPPRSPAPGRCRRAR